MKKIFLFLLMGIFLFNLVSAEANPCGSENSFLDNLKKGDNITLYQYCDDCTYSNVTSMRFPNSTIHTLNRQMTKTGQEFTTFFAATNELGCYSYLTKGDKNGETSFERIDFKISPSGFTDTLGFYILILVLSLGFIVLGYYAEDATIVILGAFGLGFIGLYFLFNGIAGMKDSVYTWAISIIVLGVASYLLARSANEFLN